MKYVRQHLLSILASHIPVLGLLFSVGSLALSPLGWAVDTWLDRLIMSALPLILIILVGSTVLTTLTFRWLLLHKTIVSLPPREAKGE
jgi:hypothetical protein